MIGVTRSMTRCRQLIEHYDCIMSRGYETLCLEVMLSVAGALPECGVRISERSEPANDPASATRRHSQFYGG